MSRMKEIRLEKGLMQKDIAIKTGLSGAAISLYENGLKTPSMNSAHKIATVLDTTIEELFLFEKEKEVI